MAPSVSLSVVGQDEEDVTADLGPPANDPWGNNILLVEDNLRDAQLIRRLLERESSDFHIHHVGRLDEAVEALHAQEFTVVLLDLRLPDASGLDGLREVTGAAPSAPVIVLTGLSDQRMALEALQAGAQDFLSKRKFEGGALLRAMRFAIERKRSETRLAYLAHHDQLTGLINRTLFRERLGWALARARRCEERVALLFLDLDRFKQVNDTLGHEAGDQLLVEVAHRLRRCVRSFEPVARLGGDEFVVLLESITDPSAAEAVANRILAAVDAPFDLGGAQRHVSTSVGVAVSTGEDDVDALLERADEAMYRAKRAGRNAVSLSNPGAGAESITVLEIERALQKQEFEVLYQPKLALVPLKVTGTEALLRWHHPRRGKLTPEELLPLLESTGRTVSVGDWVLRRACEQARRFASDPGFRLAVNIAAEQFDRDGLVAAVADVLSETGFSPGSLELDVTAPVLLRSVERAREVLKSLRQLGVRICLDELTARTSLGDLKDFSFDIIKIDRSLVSGIPGSPAQRAVVSGVVSLARAEGIETVAVGVETAAEQACLRQLGCDTVQGYHICGPMDAVGFTVWLASHEAGD